ncbi:BapA prefix-like domain-containing protein [Pseudomonas sp. SK3(2021)]|uniref:Ig-like domain-containing protein n=1 Tax=Pseudomonas sp. SK3(2021) TaxID=2841064 RepID=UPI00192BBDFE|nr:Ig-like domain-containing protein [Pseudomonas sp. SK3(2021)]QQZ39520.1 BapA prefix-like domain-containing protein [Pseudomonas sp. SK3(2021)]
MTEVFVFDKKAQTQAAVSGPEIVLESASVVVLGVGRASIKQMTRKGQSLVIELAGNEKLVIKNYFDKFEGQDNSLVINEDGQLVEVFISEPVGLGDQLAVSYEPFQQTAAEALADGSVLGKLSAALNGLTPLSKGLLLGGAALGAIALFQRGKGGSGNHHGGSDGTPPEAVDTTPPEQASGLVTKTESDGKMTVNGKAEPGSTVEVKFPDGSTGTTVTKPDGSFELTSKTPQPNGEFTTTVSDAAGNKGESVTGSYTADPVSDTTPPGKASDLVASTESDGKMTVNGKAEPGSTVEVKFPDGSTGTTVTKPDGSFELTSKTPQPNGEFTTTVSDAAGNKGESVTGSYTADPVSDTTPPGKASDLVASTESDGKMTVNGKAEPGSTVEVKFPDGSTGTTVTKPDGSFELTSKTPQPNGEFTTTVSDAAGNKGESVTGSYTADPVSDTTPPGKASDLVASTESDGKMTVNGKAEPGSTVEVKFPDGSTGTTVTKPDGSFELTSKTPQPNGEFTTTVSDAAGNKGESVTGSYTADPVSDTTPPGKASDLVASTESDGKMTVNGKAEPGSTVEVKFPDGSTGTTVTKPDGSFELTSKTPQPNGEFTTTVSDAAGNKGESVTGSYTADPVSDTTPPGKASDLVASTESDGKMTVNGKAEPGSTVEVKFPDGSTGTTVTKPDGSFELTSKTPQPNGEFTTTVSDAAGNKGESVTGSYTADPVSDTTPPGKASDLVASTESDGKMTVNGKAEPGSTVEVKFPDGSTGTTVTKPDGSFELTSKTPQPNGEFTTTVSDAAGNKGESVTGSYTADPVSDTTPPGKASDLVASTESDGKMTVNGKAEPGSTVEVKFPDGSTGTTVTKPDGSFELTSKTPQPNGEFTTTVSDAAGNKGESVTGSYTADPVSDTTPPGKASDLVASTESDGKMTVNGKAEPGSTVEVKFPDGSTGTTVTKPDGSFELTSKTPQPNGEFTTTVSDAAGNKGESVTGSYTANNTGDAQAPDSPTGLTAVTQPDGTAKVSGKAEPNSTVNVTLPDGTTQETKAGPDGSFELVSATPQPNGTVTATATDAAGNTGAPAQVEFTASNGVDTKAPEAPTGLTAVTQPDGTAKVSGKAEPNSTVNVTLPDGTTQETKAGPDGSFELVSATPQPNGTVTATATDAAGNTGAPAQVEFTASNGVDTKAPEAPTGLTAVTQPDGTAKVSGKAEPNSTVKVTLPDGTTQETKAGPDGSFELVSATPQPNGTVTATATDAAGNTGAPAQVEFTASNGVDTKAPEAPTGLTAVTQPDGTAKVSGKAEPNSTVKVTLPDGTTQETKAGPDGSFELVSATPQPNGTVTATATDAAGNTGAPAQVEFTASNGVDTKAPEAPTGLTAVTQPDGTAKVSGKAEPNSTVNVTLPDGTTQETKAGPDGSFELVSATPQPNGTVTATATDAAGNTGAPAQVEFTASNGVDTKAPEAPTGLTAVTQPDGTAKVSGKAEPNSTVKVTLPDGTTQETKAGPDGSFELVSATPQPNGTVTATATDAAGNTGAPAQVEFTASNGVDTKAPEAPTGLTAVTQPDGTAKVSGKAEPNSTVKVTLPDGTTQETKAGPDGSFELVSATPQPNGTVTATATDAAGNTGAPAQVEFTASNGVDTKAPEAPTGLTAVTQPDGTAKVSGKAEPNSTVNVTLPDGTTQETKAGPDGSFELVSATPQPNGTVTATATDAAGNTGAPAQVEFTASNGVDTKAPEAPTGLTAVTQPDGTAKVSGKAEPNSTVNVTLPDGTTQETKAGPDGSFELVSATPQPNGTVTATATDAAGNTGAPAQVEFTASNGVDTKAPEAPTGLTAVTQPDGTAKVSGKAEPNSTVKVTLPDGTTQETKAGPDGSFELVSATPQPNGTVTATATDAAGNTGAPAQVEFTASNGVDTKAPEAPTGLTAVTQPDGTAKVSGKAEPNSTVNVTLPDGTTQETKAGPDGSFELVSATPQPNGTVTATATDAAGNTGAPAQVEFTASNGVDTKAPEAPTGLTAVTQPDGTAKVSGKAEPNSTVNVTLPDGTTQETKAGPDGSFELVSATPQPNGTVTATATDAAGNTGAPAQVEFTASNGVDTKAPEAPTGLTAVTQPDGTAKVSGKAEPNSTVKVTLPDGTTQETKAGPDGSFELVSATPQPNGTVTATATDAAGNTGAPAQVEFTASNGVDTKAPEAPTGLTAVTQPDGTAKVSGKAEPNSTVKVTLPDGTTQETKAGPDGSFELVSATPQPNGTVTATATDAAGNTGAPAQVEFTASNGVDTKAPEAPTGLTAVTQPDGTAKVSGKAEPNSTVNVTLPDGTTQETKAGPDGSFELVSATPQPNGTVTATATDAAGNTGAPAQVEFTASNGVDTKAPEAPTGLTAVTQPDGTAKVSGKAEPNSTVKVTLPDGTTQETKAGPDGSFELVSATPQPNGTVTATATDAAGNTGAPAQVEFTASNGVDTKAPEAPTGLTAVTQPDGTAKVSGKAEPNSTVKVTLPDGTTQETKAGPDGSFELVSATPQPNGTVTATATDAAGNTGAPAQVEFTASNGVDTKAPEAPTGLTAVTQPDGTVKVSGKAEPNSTVTVTFTDGTQGSVLAKANGDFTLTSTTAQKTAGTISSTAKDAAGNESPAATLPFVPVPAPDAPVFTEAGTDPVTGLLTIKGTAPANMKVQLTFPDGTVKEVRTDGAGRFSLTSDAPQEAAKFSAVAINDAGSSSTVTEGTYLGNPNVAYSLTIDGYIDNVAPDEGFKLTSIATNDNTPELTGKSEGVGKTDQLIIMSQGVKVGVAVVSPIDGVWHFTLPVTSDGVHDYTLEIRNALDITKASATTSLTIDTLPPQAPTIDLVTVTQAGTSNAIQLPADKKTSDNTPDLKGKAEANSTVILYTQNSDGNEVEVGRTKADQFGSWSMTTEFLANRVHTLYAKAMDAVSSVGLASAPVVIDITGPTEIPRIVDINYVWSADSAGDINGDGFDDIASGVFKDSTIGALRGGEYVGKEAPKVFLWLDGNRTAYHQAGVGDINGDGFNDITTIDSDSDGTREGYARLYLGGTSVDAGWQKSIFIPDKRPYFVASAGDLDGDGLMDVVFGAKGASGEKSTPKTAIRFGNPLITDKPAPADYIEGFTFGTPLGEKNGSMDAAYSGAQYVTSAGDFNGDGVGDIVTARGITFGNNKRGEITYSSDLEWRTGPTSRELNQVQAVSGIGDANGDGYGDVAVQDGRNVFVVFGGPVASGNNIILEASWLKNNNRGFAVDTSWASTQVTTHSDIRGIGDVNGDGLADFAYTTYGNAFDASKPDFQGLTRQVKKNYSNSYIIFGQASTDTIDVKNLTAKQGVVVPRAQADGATLAGRIDINGDGLADVYVGSYEAKGKLYMGGSSLGAEPSYKVINGLAKGDESSNFIAGTAGRDYIVGNGGTDVIYSGSGDDIIVLNSDNLARLATGFDTKAGLNGRLARVDGGNGVDTLKFDKDVTAVDLTEISNAGIGTIRSGVGLSRLANIERLDLRDTKAKLTLELKDVMDMSAGIAQVNKDTFSGGLDPESIKRHQLVIDGSADNTVEVQGRKDWITTKVATVNSYGHSYDIYNSVGDFKGQLLIEQGINVVWA